jgi:hypothetical protein
MSPIQKHSNFCFVLQKKKIPYFFDVFNLGANKEDLLHVIDYIISLNSFISKSFQHVMSLITNMCFLIRLHIMC